MHFFIIHPFPDPKLEKIYEVNFSDPVEVRTVLEVLVALAGGLVGLVVIISTETLGVIREVLGLPLQVHHYCTQHRRSTRKESPCRGQVHHFQVGDNFVLFLQPLFKI